MTTQQLDLFGDMAPPQDLDLRSKVAYILETHPETRDDDRLLTLWYWYEWNSIEAVISQAQFEDLLDWCQKADHPETIRRRRQEIQQLRTGKGTLQPSPGTANFRQARDGAGPPRRNR